MTQLQKLLILESKMKSVVEKLEQLLPHKKYQVDVYNNLLMSTIPYYILAAITFAGYLSMEYHSFVFIVIIYSILPILDEIVSFDWRNPTRDQRIRLEQNNWQFKFVVYFTAILDWFLFFKMMDLFANYQITPFSILNVMGLIFIFSNLEATQFAIAHQIFHKQNFIDRFFGTLHMSKLLYMHFTYEHIWGHHKKVATPQDTASAQKGINVYKFIIRSIIGTFKSVYNMQVEAKKPIYLNYSILSVIGSIVFCFLIYRVYGLQAFVLYFICAVGAVFYLEAINYIQHYGLRREKKANGQYQKVTIRHSWNAPHRLSNYLLFKLQRHSDHHQNCLKPYQTLDSLEESPQLSHGYTLTIIMSFFPSVWSSVMDPLVDEYQKLKTGNISGEVRSKANRLIRQFIIQLTLASCFLCMANYAILYLGENYQQVSNSI